MNKEKFRFTLMGRVEIKEYSIDYNMRYGYPRTFMIPYIKESFRLKEHSEIAKEKDLILDVLESGDKLFVNEINKTVEILEAYPTTDGRYIYFTDYVIERIEDGEEVEESWTKADKIVKAYEACMSEEEEEAKSDPPKNKSFFSKLFKK